MHVATEHIELNTKGDADIIDVTAQINKKLKSSGLKSGIVNINVCGSTAALTTCEYEPGLVKDLKELFDKLIPDGRRYHHDDAWHDGNGHAHLRSSLMGTSLTMPFSQGALILGTWQQIILIDFDNRARERKIVLQILGE